ncbi:hypothetical protein GF359_01310 [candidate division WOR-3 bacterium]|uniref:Biopolymer transporter ExbD n=1 Tax=candidate division WOR-3 bacterium TaxID=2052148 RepID=A0A9D5K7R4_UNCW3|nr:hypothetical protein [candidate division WOR-3 bacterium]MBD3363833.1 hypothetical protein [candidate division WOR-3 bacterium]
MRIRKPSRRVIKSGEANVTSLVDIALSLVIFFIVTLPALLESGIFVRAPGVTNVGASDPADDVKVSIYMRHLPGDQIVYELNKEPVERVELPGLMEALLARSADKIVMVRADGAVSHGRVVDVLDLAKQKEAQSLALLRGKPIEETQ